MSIRKFADEANFNLRAIRKPEMALFNDCLFPNADYGQKIIFPLVVGF